MFEGFLQYWLLLPPCCEAMQTYMLIVRFPLHRISVVLEHVEIPCNYSEKTVILVLIVLLLFVPLPMQCIFIRQQPL